MNILHAFILGVVEGVTEFLPISSTAHLLLVGDLFGLKDMIYFQSFTIFIQIGAMGAVLVSSFEYFFNTKLLVRILVAFIPTALVGALLQPLLHKIFLHSWTIIALAMILGSFLIIVIDKKYKNSSLDDSVARLEKVPLWKYLCIGFLQSFAIIPGVSRSLVTIFGGVISGLSRADAVFFSFLLAVPTIGAAGMYDILKLTEPMGSHLPTLLVGFLTSFVIAYAVMQWFLAFVQKKSLHVFFWYRIVLGFILLFFFV